jgi:N-acyl homoserine lactone hydrolase
MSDFPVIKPLLVGVFPQFELSSFLYGRKQGQKQDCPCIMFLIEAGDKKIVVDTGPCSPEKAVKYHVPLIRDDRMRPEMALQNVGVHPDDVDIVILSHLHWDHCSNCSMFKNARFMVQKQELQFAVTPNMLQRSQYEVGFRDLLPPWMEVFQQLETIDGDVHDLVKGVHILSLPGHTPGLMGVAVETRSGVYAIASDCVPLVENWEGDSKLPHIPNGIYVNPDDYESSFEKLEKVAKYVLASHDFRTLQSDEYR